MKTEIHMHTNVTALAEIEQFKDDVLLGLSLPAKQLPYKYCFDTHGCSLFQKLIAMPEVYPAHCESAILDQYKEHLAIHLGNKTFNLIEFGPAGFISSKVLIDAFLADGLTFHYYNIDTSRQYLEFIANEIQTAYPTLPFKPIHTEYVPGLNAINTLHNQKNIILFLGSNISTLPNEHISALLKQVRRILNSGDHLLIGFDLRKNIDALLKQHNEIPLYQQLNLNILEHINRELEGNFNINQFKYVATHNRDTECIDHYLVCASKQTVTINALNQSFDFKQDEPIYLGSAFKYREQQIITLAESNGFEVMQMFTDEGNHFIDSLWKISK